MSSSNINGLIDSIPSWFCKETFENPRNVELYKERKELQDEYLKLLAENLRWQHIAMVDDADASIVDGLVTDRICRVLNQAIEILSTPEKRKAFVCDGLFKFVKRGFKQIPNEIAEEIQKITNVQGHFYRIEDSEGNTKGYLLGTIHIMHSTLMNMNAAIQQAVAKANYLFLEIKEWDLSLEDADKRLVAILESLPVAQIEEALGKYMQILSSHPELLQATTWQELEATIAQLDPLEGLKLCIKQFQYVSAKINGTVIHSNTIVYGIDDWLYHQFNEKEKAIFGLESAEEQFQIAREVLSNSNLQNDLLYSTLHPNLKAKTHHANQMCKEWKLGEIQPIQNQKGTLEYKIFETRSKKFGDVIYKQLISSDGIGFYACGENHLYDGKGIIKRLQKRNFKLIRM